MPKIESWDGLPAGVRQHLIDRMRDRAISIASRIMQARIEDSVCEELEGWLADPLFNLSQVAHVGRHPAPFDSHVLSPTQ